jgi:8-oxo-dGTP pyrophosphatase MutT (NUDIX family)
MIWKPHVTVAAVAERDGQFLMVQERVDGQSVLNQPAGHLEDNESLLDAVVRETFEETAWHFAPERITGIYRWREPVARRTWLRVCFAGTLLEHDPGAALDEGIEQAIWLPREALLRQPQQLRSPLVMRCIDDYLAGACYPLQLLSDIG